MARINVEAGALHDVRFRKLALRLQLADGDHARGKMEHVWFECLNRETYSLPIEDVALALGRADPDAVADALVDCDLAERIQPGWLRIRGTAGRIEWLAGKRLAAVAGGKARAKQAKRQANGTFAPASDQPPDQPPTSQASQPDSSQPTSPPAPATYSCSKDRETASPVAVPRARRAGVKQIRYKGDDVILGKIPWLEEGIGHFGNVSARTRTLLARIADDRKHGVSESVLRETARSLSVIFSEGGESAYAHGLEQILLNDDFEFAGKPSRVVNYIKSCMASYRPNAQRTPRSPRRDPNNLTGDDLRELRLKLESEGR